MKDFTVKNNIKRRHKLERIFIGVLMRDDGGASQPERLIIYAYGSEAIDLIYKKKYPIFSTGYGSHYININTRFRYPLESILKELKYPSIVGFNDATRQGDKTIEGISEKDLDFICQRFKEKEASHLIHQYLNLNFNIKNNELKRELKLQINSQNEKTIDFSEIFSDFISDISPIFTKELNLINVLEELKQEEINYFESIESKLDLELNQGHQKVIAM